MLRTLLLPLLLMLGAATAAPAATDPGTLVWKFKAGGQIWSPPALDAATLYVGNDDGNLYAIDVNARSLKWTFPTQDKVRSRPAVSGGRVFVASDDGYLYAVDAHSGAEAWRFDLKARDLGRRPPSPDTPFYDFLQSSPVVHEGRVYVGSLSGRMFAIDAGTGKEVWSIGTADAVRGDPVIDEDSLYFGSWDDHVYAVDLQSHAVRWRSDTGGIVQSTPAVANGLVVVGSRAAAIVAFNAATGAETWRYSYPDGSWVESSPVYSGGLVFAGSSDALKLSAFTAEDGKEAWSFKTNGWTWSTPAVRNGIVYIGAISAFPHYFEGVTLVPGFYALDAATGEKQWAFTPEKVSGFVTGGVAVAPAIGDGMVYVGALDGYIYALKE